MNKVILPVLTAIVLMSCGSENSSDIEVTEHDGNVSSAISSNAKVDPEKQRELERLKKEEEARVAKEKQNSTSLTFDKLKHDFGTIAPDTDNLTEFIVTNTGERPLIISDVSASCGCTMPQKPEEPIAPGKSDVIKVKFHPKPNQIGEITKTVTVTANTMERIHKVDIRAFVDENL